jgi:hypothetical protein
LEIITWEEEEEEEEEEEGYCNEFSHACCPLEEG